MSEFNTYLLSVPALFELSRVDMVISWHDLSLENALKIEAGFNAAKSSNTPGTNPLPPINLPSGMLLM
jgi:hypothetical protein